MTSTAEEWNNRYSQFDRMWSGNPNDALIHAVTQLGLDGGSAIDVGCGEGADALWLASRGWGVTACDPSSVAVDRARAADVAHRVTWFVAGLEDFELGTFDLVTAMYPVLDPTAESVERLHQLVAPGGVLIFTHHEGREDCLTPAMVAELFPGQVLLDERHHRDVAHGAGSHHHTDHIVVVRRARH